MFKLLALVACLAVVVIAAPDPVFKDYLECPAVKDGELGTCSVMCETDDDCQGDGLLCCSNGCGKTCRFGVLPKKTGTCPFSDSFGPCHNYCEEDRHCPSSMKCCYRGCARMCVVPY